MLVPFKIIKIDYVISSLLFLVILAAELLLILTKNHGVFTYTLDDPYIHFNLAKRIMMGSYGLNTGEYSSPDSSILWPFLLAPFSFWPGFSIIPLVLNILSALGVLWTFAFLFQSLDKTETVSGKKLFLLALLIPALNLTGLVLMGMEHSLQMLLTVLLLLGLIEESRSEKFPLWLSLVIILGPLIRYENLTFSIPGLMFLFYRGHHKKAVITFLVLSGLLLSFSLFLYHLGQPLLPASVLNKTSSVYKTSFLSVLSTQFLENLANQQAAIFFIYLSGCLAILYLTPIKTPQKQLVILMLTSIILHLLWGKFDWFERYELYLHAAFWFLMFYLYWTYLAELNFSYYLGLCILLILCSLPYFRTLSLIYWASNNIYLQQRQMREFALHWIKGPVAVNDIGLVSFNNPYYILDLWGLGNYSVHKLQALEKNPQWMDDLSQHYHARLAMINTLSFPYIPRNWRLLGCLTSSGKRIIVPSLTVHFYATRPEYYLPIKKELIQFKAQLPEGDRFLFDCKSNAQ